ncbi:hypothetical protein FDECE_751 [Fusarium decemcellulare]|nr:hypothetical protein FDECE_751 [Fusarium decemcellulare]
MYFTTASRSHGGAVARKSDFFSRDDRQLIHHLGIKSRLLLRFPAESAQPLGTIPGVPTNNDQRLFFKEVIAEVTRDLSRNRILDLASFLNRLASLLDAPPV